MRANDDVVDRALRCGGVDFLYAADFARSPIDIDI